MKMIKKEIPAVIRIKISNATSSYKSIKFGRAVYLFTADGTNKLLMARHTFHKTLDDAEKGINEVKKATSLRLGYGL